MKVIHISIFLVFIYCGYCHSEDTQQNYSIPDSPSEFIKAFKAVKKTEKNYVLKKFFLLALAFKREVLLNKEVEAEIRNWLNELLSDSKYDEKHKIKAVDFYNKFQLVPDAKDRMLKEYLLFSSNPPEVLLNFIDTTTSRGNWYNDSYYKKLTIYINSNPKIAISNKFIILYLLDCPPLKTNIQYDKNKFTKYEYFSYLFAVAYFNVIKNSPKILVYANYYEEYSCWQCFLYEADLHFLKQLLPLIQKRLKLVKASDDAELITPYLNFLLKDPWFEIRCLTSKNIPVFEKMSKKSPEIKLLCDKVIRRIKEYALKGWLIDNGETKKVD